ncbi:MAG: hypothetical protein ABGX33_02300 [Cycloclasticus sp.]
MLLTIMVIIPMFFRMSVLFMLVRMSFPTMQNSGVLLMMVVLVVRRRCAAIRVVTVRVAPFS